MLALKDTNVLPQCRELKSFIVDNQIKDISFDYTTGQHNTIGLIVNHQYHSLDELRNLIISASRCASKYFYLAVNKFYIYSTTNSESDIESVVDYDTKLVNYCYHIIVDQFDMIKYTTEPNDCGSLGNFVHPVTTMFFKRHG